MSVLFLACRFSMLQRKGGLICHLPEKKRSQRLCSHPVAAAAAAAVVVIMNDTGIIILLKCYYY